ncbi:MarR family winged helix-turn-helix transcriptional regulator [Paenibacillus cineris]|uniref:MarR family winged helix-turn-helix transcriptional regulator n=1 Tax=Paenibacillus cineris TaxID=237530 RepID=UPI001B0890CB|nr:MarR family winged helix-turn-helix transcriptional regulator [Paenibacillus cineris]GIO59670.1 MarR family transcriptional regulator [Paenibacillus cineris]
MDNNNHETGRAQLEIHLGQQLNALLSASHALHVKTAAVFDPNLQPAAFLLVRWLLAYGPSSATSLAESLAMDRSSVSRLVAQLKNAGYVHSEPDPHDRRGVVLSVTDLGRNKAVLAMNEKGVEFYDRISDWDDSSLEAFIQMLKRFNGL